MFIKSSFVFLFIFAAVSAQNYNSGRFEQQQQQAYDGASSGNQQQQQQQQGQYQEDQRPPTNSVEGEAGPEPPATIPQTSFTCDGKPYDPGMYADMEVACSVYHMCFNGRKESFLCGTGTMFNQEILSCDHPQNVDCNASPNFYNTNEELGKPGAEPAPGAQAAPRPRPPPPAATRPVAQRPVSSGGPRPLPRPAPVQRPVAAPRPQITNPSYGVDESTDYDGQQQPDSFPDQQPQAPAPLPSLPAPPPPPARIPNPAPRPAPIQRPTGKVSPRPSPPAFRPPPAPVSAPRPAPVKRPIPAPRPVSRPAQVFQQPAQQPQGSFYPAPAPAPAFRPVAQPAPVRRPSKTSPRRPAPQPIAQPPVVQTTDEDPDYEPSSVYYSQELPKQQQRSSRYSVSSSRRWNQYRS